MASVAEPIPGAFAPSRPAIKIVPVRALPIVAVVLVGLVAAIATNSQWALDFYHVAGGGQHVAHDETGHIQPLISGGLCQ